jgi:DNA repair protein RadC
LIEIILFSILGILLIFTITHILPLNANEINQLGTKRRTKEIKKYYSFDRVELTANKDFKSKMNATGKFYNIKENLNRFPASAAALLKYIKHEWIIIAFETQKNIFLLWCNKGFDRSSAGVRLSIQQVLEIASRKKITSILFFHNHPNPNPAYYNTSKPSERDLVTAKEWSLKLHNNDINLIEFVCERGRSYEYFRSISKNFALWT